ncbi:hypothetical protein JD844_023550 [Phrynosoma platyrhinos]|uniref:ESF1 homolog n=1 Tax=Phrynosoma platyrhinos TaxID=52577 RepID=A0ABQ7SX22_PHRPL|nr:hypothetical protein JD844_023550 [Phrynosoma platyrhinos]
MEPKKEVMNDQRFSRITKDPRFWEMPEKDRKIKIDKRFRAMFHDKKFKLKYTVDKRGRPINHSSTEDLKRFYALSDSDSDVSEGDDKQTETKKTKPNGKRGSEKSVDAKDSNVAGYKSSPVSKIDDFKNESQNSKPLKSIKDMKNTTAIETVEDKEIGPKMQKMRDGMSAESMHLCQKSSQKTAKKEAVKECSPEEKDDSSVSCVNKKYFKNKTCKNEESSDLDESEGSVETEEEGESGENGDLEEERDGGEMKEESDSDEEEGETGEGSETDDDESDSGPDLARGKGNVETSSEDEEEDDMTELFPKEPEIVHRWGELTKDAPRADKITCRLAVCNMDWDRLKAKDLLALFNSFTPKGGVIFSVKIYPSEFGKARMKDEEVNGPTELLSLPEDVTEKDSIYKEKLRDYQFKRLRYFYAVVECDSPETANKIYEEFIPDDVTFDDEPKDMASEVDGAAYKPKYFTSAAVATSKVDITWDETDHERVTSLNRTFKKDELLDMDFQAYLASSSEEDEEDEDEEGKHQQDVDVTQKADKHKSHPKDDEEQIAKYRELLQSIQEKEKKHQETDMEMEIKWIPGLKESAEEMVRNKLEGKDKLTPWEQFLEKKKEKRKLKKKQKAAAEETLTEDECPSDVDCTLCSLEKNPAEMSLLVMDEEDDERRHFNYDKIVEQQNLSKKKKKLLMKKKELLTDDFQVNVADARFQAMYTSHLFNLDPSDPNFKKTKAVEKILEEKTRRRQQGSTAAIEREDSTMERESAASKSLHPALSMLIKSVKNKTEQFQARKKQKVK